MKLSESDLKKLRDRGVIPATPVDALGDLAGTVRAVVAAGFPEPVPEFRFHPTRKFRFDLAWPDYLVAFEREGGSFKPVTCACGRKRTVFVSRHHSRTGMERDIEKYNLCQIAGWVVVRATPGMIVRGVAATHLLDALKNSRVR